MLSNLHDLSVIRLVDIALQEDIGSGDITTESVLSQEAMGGASVIVKQDGVIFGLPVAALVFQRLDSDEYERTITWTPLVEEGSFVKAGTIVARVEGRTRVLLEGERAALNFLQRLSGVASQTRRYVTAVEGTQAKVCDTRKTVPAWRLLDKYAVRLGGGENHRFGLHDMALIKDNHRDAAGSLSAALKRCNEALVSKPNIAIEVETRSLDDVREVLACLDEGMRAERIMFDNFTPFNVRKAVSLTARRALTEASGGVTLANIRQYAETGVDFISVGALTHSVPALDISMKIAV